MSLVTHGAVPFWPQGLKLVTLGRGPLGDAIFTEYQGSGPYGLKHFFNVFPI